MKGGVRVDISVVICTYNGENYLKEQLESIKNQTLLPNEIVICDDISTDNTILIIEEFSKTVDFPVNVYINNSNLGSTKNFEKGMKLCGGEIIVFSDQDDVWLPHKLERLKNTFENYPEAGLIFTNGSVVGGGLEKLGYTIWDFWEFTDNEKREFRNGNITQFLFKRNVVTGATMAIKSKYLDVIPSAPDNWVHDHWIALIISTLADIYFLEEDLIMYRQHGNNLVGAVNKDKYFKNNLASYFNRFKKFKDLLESKDVGTDLKINIKEHVDILNLISVSLENQSSFDVKAESIDYISKRLKHFKTRYGVIKGNHNNVLRLFNELVSFRYSKYSNGVSSFGKDILLKYLR